MDNKQRTFNLPKYKNRRSALRKNMTEPEKRFWQAVRNKQLGFKFRRQQGIGRYIVDFYCAELELVVEIDGDSHFDREALTYDKERAEYLTRLGLKIMRFTNYEVMRNLEAVLVSVVDPSLTLPLAGEGTNPSPFTENGTNSSPCQGGNREGVPNSAMEFGCHAKVGTSTRSAGSENMENLQ
jgi:very-short-patch-repair endonuclease